MRSSSLERVSHHSTPRYHQSVVSVEYRRAANELRTILLSPLHAVSRGARSHRLSQIGKDVARGQNRACETVVELLFGPQDQGVDIDLLRTIPATIDGLLSARIPEQKELSLDDLQLMETEIESLMNPIQLSIAMGDHSLLKKRQLYNYVLKAISVLEKMKKSLERDLFGGRH